MYVNNISLHLRKQKYKFSTQTLNITLLLVKKMSTFKMNIKIIINVTFQLHNH